MIDILLGAAVILFVIEAVWHKSLVAAGLACVALALLWPDLHL